MIPLTYKAISLSHLSFKCLPASILQSWKAIISAVPWEAKRVNQLWLLTNQMSTINYNTNQFIRLLASFLFDQLLRNFNTEHKKSQSRTLIRVSEVWNAALKQIKLEHSKVAQQSRRHSFHLCDCPCSQWIDCYGHFSGWSLSKSERHLSSLPN